MSSLIPKIPSYSVARSLICRALCTSATEARTKKLERIADDLLDLNKIERHDYNILFFHKMGLNRFGPAASAPAPQSSSAGGGTSSAPAAAKEKTAFDVKLEKFDASAKLKVIKEIRAFTDLGLKEAKELVEKAPAVVKKGVTKEEAEKIVAKLKEVGATVGEAELKIKARLQQAKEMKSILKERDYLELGNE